MTATSARAATLTKLKESGLNERDAKQLGIEPLEATQAKKLGPGFEALNGMKIPYFGADGSPTRFFRVRYLERPKGFAGISKRWHKYSQPADTPPVAYFPRLGGIDWRAVLDDVEIPLYLTEGELKAAAGCKCGLPVIGLGGVYAWRSTRLGVGFIEDLEAVRWQGRAVTLVFDSDSASNSNVQKALLHLCAELTTRGAIVYVAKLPTLDGADKTGLDDFLVAHGYEAFAEVAASAEPFQASRELWALSAEVAYVIDPGLVVNLETGQRITPNAFVSHAYANRHYYETSFDKQGNARLVKRPLAKAWVGWPHRHALRRMTYAPGDARITDRQEYNFWSGWGVEPQRGDVRPWTALLDYLFSGAKPEARKWFEQWCAYPLQYPGTKLFSAVLVWGIAQGTGKSLVAYTLGRIYGDNFVEIKQQNLHASHNEWAENKQFVLGDEITGSDKRIDSDTLKKLITQQTVTINPKYIPAYTVPDRINYFFTSQHPDAFFLEDRDRRYFVHEVIGDPMPREFYRTYDRWYRSEEGAAALFDYLLNLDLDGFDPNGHAMQTDAKREMIYMTKSDLGAWVHGLVTEPDGVLRMDGTVLKSDLWTPEQLLAMYDPDGKTRVTAGGVGRELRRAGLRLVCNGPVRTSTGTKRLYAVRNGDKWARANAVDAAAHFDKHFGPKAAKF